MKVRALAGISLRLFRTHWKRNILLLCTLSLGGFFFFSFGALTLGLEKFVFQPARSTLRTESVLAEMPGSISQGGSSVNPSGMFGISAPELEKIKSWPQVRSIATETKIPFPVAASADLFLGIKFNFDAILTGVSVAAVREELPVGESFDGQEEILPILISPLLVEIYNSTIVELIPGLQRKSLNDFLGRTLEFTFGRTNYLPLLSGWPSGQKPLIKKAKVIGFAPFLSPLTFAVPEPFAKKVLAQASPETAVLPQAVLITPSRAEDVAELKRKLEAEGLKVRDLSQNFATLQNLFGGFDVLLFGAGSTVLIAVLLLFGTVVAMNAAEYKKSIALLRILGASFGDAVLLLFFQGFLPAFFALGISVSGTFWAAAWFSRNFFSLFPFLAGNGRNFASSIAPFLGGVWGLLIAAITLVLLWSVWRNLRRLPLLVLAE